MYRGHHFRCECVDDCKGGGDAQFSDQKERHNQPVGT